MALPASIAPLLSYAFRPFFLAAAAFAAVAMALWILPFAGIDADSRLDLFWHTHEMLFGFVAAAIAGFLLTAIANWTGRPPVRGVHLALLVSLWLLARIALITSASLAPALVLALGGAFSWLLMATVAVELVAARNRRNYGFIVLLFLFALADSVHIGAYVHGWAEVLRWVQALTPHVVVLFITVIGGRIIPAFTRNWLAARGEGRMPVTSRAIELAVVPATAAVGIADALGWPGSLLALLSGAACIVHSVRLLGWRGWQTRREGLLVMLHVGYAWLPCAYALLALSASSDVLSASAALHAMTAGAMGAMILAVMPRVTSGHTGRALHASRATAIGFSLVVLSGIVRVALGAAPALAPQGLVLSGLLWVLAFACFLIGHAPSLVRPRVA